MRCLKGRMRRLLNSGVLGAFLGALEIVLIAFFCAFSSLDMLCREVQLYMGRQYSRWGCTNEK